MIKKIQAKESAMPGFQSFASMYVIKAIENAVY